MTNNLTNISVVCHVGKFRLRLAWESHTNSYVMTGGPNGMHRLDTSNTDDRRLLAHWAGYCSNAGEYTTRIKEVDDSLTDWRKKMAGRRLTY